MDTWLKNLTSGKLKTRKPSKARKSRNFFSEFSSSEFLILDIRSKSKSRKRKSPKKISEVSELSPWPVLTYVEPEFRLSCTVWSCAVDNHYTTALKIRACDTGGGVAMVPQHFCVAKRKKREKGEKDKISKGCHQDQNIIVLAILERLQFKNFSCRPTMVVDNTFQCSMAPPLSLSNPFRRCWKW